ncbi:hypothetical protein C1752_03335 [Acaryochloris thomasi RCC1774]|uniref:Uncharacterized protein n=1 Tax=Acaryochloris thomasi RCC1774 TaxID=1764569 RepID=A0A2W1JW02_9CYAN|nr:hypothetical protein C1752_03335 [Acaryochloris thomasi RCC1774]
MLLSELSLVVLLHRLNPIIANASLSYSLTLRLRINV